jgi:hypothetical protein
MTTDKSRSVSTHGSDNSEAEVEGLKELAEARARALGHAPGRWHQKDDDGAVGWRTMCDRCGAVAYVRYERGLLGLAGALSTSVCTKTNLECA